MKRARARARAIGIMVVELCELKRKKTSCNLDICKAVIYLVQFLFCTVKSN